VDVGLYGQQLSLGIVSAKDGESSVLWSSGDNSAAFKPAIYSPYPGPKREWCLYVDIGKSIAVLVEKYPGTDAATAFLVDGLQWTRKPNGIEGHGTARVFRFGDHGGNSEAVGEELMPKTSQIDFFLRDPERAAAPPSEFMSIIERVLAR
jgi:hypothetical protein